MGRSGTGALTLGAGVLVAAVFLDSSFTDFGHLVALVIGLATAPRVIGDRIRPNAG